MPAVIATAPQGPPPRYPTKVEKMISGAGSRPDSARPSRNCALLIQAPRVTASCCRNGMTVYAPPKVNSPAFNPDQNSAGSGMDATRMLSPVSGPPVNAAKPENPFAAT